MNKRDELLEDLEEPQVEEPSSLDLIIATRLNRDLKKAAKLLTPNQARYYVDIYYSLQKFRIGAAAQVRSAKEEPNELITWTAQLYEKLEMDIQSALKEYAMSRVPGQWAMSITGIGPVIAAGLLAYVDILQCPTAGNLWSFAGCNPNIRWLGAKKASALIEEVLGPGKARDIVPDDLLVEIANHANRQADRLYRQATSHDYGAEGKDITRADVAAVLAKRPWNSRLKVFRWKIGQSFVMTSGSELSFYGPIYRERKLYEQQKNNAGDYAEQAAWALQEKNYGHDTDAYKWYVQGKLPPAHIEARAQRYASKLFLSHYHEVCYEDYYGVKPPKPYAIAILGHAKYISPPNWPLATKLELPEDTPQKWAEIKAKVTGNKYKKLLDEKERVEAKKKAQQEHWSTYMQHLRETSVTDLGWLEIVKKFDYHCAYCGGSFPTEFLTLHNVIPLHQGGLNNRKNVVPACEVCHQENVGRYVKPPYLPEHWQLQEV